MPTTEKLQPLVGIIFELSPRFASETVTPEQISRDDLALPASIDISTVWMSHAFGFTTWGIQIRQKDALQIIKSKYWVDDVPNETALGALVKACIS